MSPCNWWKQDTTCWVIPQGQCHGGRRLGWDGDGQYEWRERRSSKTKGYCLPWLSRAGVRVWHHSGGQTPTHPPHGKKKVQTVVWQRVFSCDQCLAMLCLSLPVWQRWDDDTPPCPHPTPTHLHPHQHPHPHPLSIILPCLMSRWRSTLMGSWAHCDGLHTTISCSHYDSWTPMLQLHRAPGRSS